MSDFLSLSLVYIVFIGAACSPGPDFFMVLRNSIGFSARAGVFTALGISLALSMHMAYSIAGVGFIITKSVFLFSTIKIIGALYLIYIGVSAFRSAGISLKKMNDKAKEQINTMSTKSDFHAFRDGEVTNFFNPKAAMFFIALFSQMLDQTLPLEVLTGFAAFCMGTAFIWFSFVAFIMSYAPVRKLYARSSKAINNVFGVFFVLLGLKLALTKF